MNVATWLKNGSPRPLPVVLRRLPVLWSTGSHRADKEQGNRIGQLAMGTLEQGKHAEQLEAKRVATGAFLPIRGRGGFDHDKHQSWCLVIEDTGHGVQGIRVWLLAVLCNQIHDLEGVIYRVCASFPHQKNGTMIPTSQRITDIED